MKKSLMILTLAASTMLATAQVTHKRAANDADRTAKREQFKDMSPDERAKRETEKVTAKLGLDAEQAAKWEAAALEKHAANAPIKEKMRGSTTPEQRRDLRMQMKANRDSFEQKVSSFLTVEQKQKWEEQKNKHHSGKKHHGDQRAMRVE